MDIIDRGSQRAEEDLERALQVRKPSGPAPTGECLFCGVKLDGGRRWCDAGCRDDWDMLERRRRARG